MSTVALTLLLALTSCSSGSSDKEPADAASSSVSTTAPTAAATPTSNSNEGIYLGLARGVEGLAEQEDATLLNLGYALCDSVEVGDQDSTLRALKTLLDTRLPARQSGELMAYASALCPEKKAALSLTGG